MLRSIVRNNLPEFNFLPLFLIIFNQLHFFPVAEYLKNLKGIQQKTDLRSRMVEGVNVYHQGVL